MLLVPCTAMRQFWHERSMACAAIGLHGQTMTEAMAFRAQARPRHFLHDRVALGAGERRPAPQRQTI